MLNFSIYKLNGDYKFSIEEENEMTISFYSNLLIIFSEIKTEEKVVNFLCTHQMSQEIKDKISELIKKYENSNIKLRRISSAFKTIPNGEYFFVFPETNFNIKQIIALNESLRLLNNGVPFENLDKELEKPMNIYDSLFKELLENYDIEVYDPKKKQIFGEKDKSKRICKYCNRSQSKGASFRDEAHAIPESLGNKTIISAEECDQCNSKFSNEIELDVFEYLKIYRVLYGKSGKNGVPKLKFKNGIEIEYKDGTAMITDKNGSSVMSPEKFKIPLEYYHEINLMNIYRGLVKFAIGVLPKEITNKLSKTIAWINNIKNDGSTLKIPKVASMIDNGNYHEQPTIVIYIRKNENYDLPHIFIELKIAFFIFVYIVPFSDDDRINFYEEVNYKKFWSINKHYNHFDSWKFNSFNYDKEKTFIMNLNMKKEGT